MNPIAKVNFYDNSSTYIGKSLIEMFSEDDKHQYLLNSILRGFDLGCNPNHLTMSYYEGMRYPKDLDDNIESLLRRDAVIATDLENYNSTYFLSVGMEYRLGNATSAGKFYVFRAPAGTKKFTVVYSEDLESEITLETKLKEDTYFFISSVNKNLSFGDGLISTREYMMTEDLQYILDGKYIPEYSKKSFFPTRVESSTMTNMVNGHYYSRSLGVEIYNRYYKAGEKAYVGSASFLCIKDGATTDFDNINHWIQL